MAAAAAAAEEEEEAATGAQPASRPANPRTKLGERSTCLPACRPNCNDSPLPSRNSALLLLLFLSLPGRWAREEARQAGLAAGRCDSCVLYDNHLARGEQTAHLAWTFSSKGLSKALGMSICCERARLRPALRFVSDRRRRPMLSLSVCPGCASRVLPPQPQSSCERKRGVEGGPGRSHTLPHSPASGVILLLLAALTLPRERQGS